MTSEQLELWLCGRDEPYPTAAEIARVLELPLREIEDTKLLRLSERRRALRFVLAVLRDLYASDRDVRGWLQTPRAELGDRSPVAALLGGRADDVETLVVADWHRPAPVASGVPTVVTRQAPSAARYECVAASRSA